MRRLHLLNAALLALLFVGSLWVWSDLPAQIPVHFDWTGAADRYAEATLLQWLLLPLLALAVAGTLYASAWWIERSVEGLNVPNQEAYDALSESEQQQVAALPLRYLYGLTTGILLLFGVLQAATYRMAVQGRDSMPAYHSVATGVFLVGLLAATVGLVVAVHRRGNRLAQDDGPSSAGGKEE
jgi:uncharacterized membrane protein